jgi:general secretion pathway protein K
MKAGARDGVILVTVLWTVALLAMLAVAASLTFRGFAGVTAVERDRSRADGLLTAGLEVAGGLVSSAGDIPLNAVETTVVLASGSVHLRLDDEGGRIDIGQAPPELLAALFRAIGAPNPDAIAKQIVDWRNDDIAGSQSGSPNGVSANPAGATTSQAAVVPAFSDVRQLLQVPGMRPEWVTAAAPLITVYGNPTVNPLTAPASVIAVLPGVTGARLAAFLEARRLYSTDATRLAGFLVDAQSFLAAKAPQAVSVQLSADLEDGYAANAEAVIVSLKGDLQPYRVLAWNPSTPQPRL